MQNKPSLPAYIFGLLAVVTAFLILAPKASMSAKTKAQAPTGIVSIFCGQPVSVHEVISKTLNPSKTTFNLEGRALYYYHDRYDGETKIDPSTQYELKVISRRDGSFEVLRGRRVPSCQNNPAKG